MLKNAIKIHGKKLCIPLLLGSQIQREKELVIGRDWGKVGMGIII